jgi:hypothetical protein
MERDDLHILGQSSWLGWASLTAWTVIAALAGFVTWKVIAPHEILTAEIPDASAVPALSVERSAPASPVIPASAPLAATPVKAVTN